MKKNLSLLLLFLISVLIFASCGSNGDSTGGNGDGGNTDGGSTNLGEGMGGMWRPEDIVYLVGDNDLPVNYLMTNFKDTTGTWLEQGSGENMLMIGKYDHPLSELAWRKMERAYTDLEENTAFSIVTDGKSIAIAYNSYVARYAAIECLFDEFNELKPSASGLVTAREFNKKEYVKAVRESEREEDFLALQGVISDGAITSLRRLYTLYGEEIYMWLINQYDPEIGGFYYSQSARDTMGFLPDVESTCQAIMYFANCGMLEQYGSSLKKALPGSMQEALVSFAKEMQDPEDGFFYHPQWGKDIPISRRGRDLGWAVRLISTFGYQPYWDTPNGYKGELGAPGTAPTSALKGRLGTSAVSAVSAIVPTALPDYLSTTQKFKAYLESLDFETNSYGAGNELDSQMGQIGARGTAYKNVLIDFLNSHQYAHNGLWEPQIDYDSVNGLMKISGLYKSCRAEIPNAEAAMKSAMQIAMTPDGAVHVCSVYNPFVAMTATLDCLSTSKANELRAILIENAEALIDITFDKLSLFKNLDGGFSYYENHSATRSQGVTVCLPADEGDVNATGICSSGTINNLFSSLGITGVQRFFAIDYAVVLDELSDMQGVIKDEIPDPELITFDEYERVLGEYEGGVEFLPHVNAETHLGDLEMDENGEYIWLKSNVVKNPDPNARRGDLVLRTSTVTRPDEEKKIAAAGSSTFFHILNSGAGSSGDCFIFDADMYFASGNGVICQLFFAGKYEEGRPCVSLNVETYTEKGVKYVKIGENYPGLDGKKDANVAGGIPMNEWVNIRIEFYKTYEEVEDEITGTVANAYFPKIKVFVNGQFKGECDANITGGGKYYNRAIKCASISSYRFNASEYYVNNVFVARTHDLYKYEESPDKLVEPSIPDGPLKEVTDFEDGLLNSTSLHNKVSAFHFGSSVYVNASEDQTLNPNVAYKIIPDPTDASNKVLSVAVKRTTEYSASKTEVYLYGSEREGSTYTFSADLYYPSASIASYADVTQLHLADGQGKTNISLRIAARNTGGVRTLSLIEYNNAKPAEGDTGVGAVIAEGIPTDKWFNLTFEFHKTGDPETTVTKYYLNGVEIYDDYSYRASGISASEPSYLSVAHQRTNTSTVYLDNVSFVKSDKAFEPIPAPNPVADFEDGILGGDFLDNYIAAVDSEGTPLLLNAKDVEDMTPYSAFTTYHLVKDPTDEANTVLKIVKNKNANAQSSSTVVKLSTAEENASCYVFETKLYIESIGGYDVMRITFGSDSYQLLSFRLYVSGSVQVKENNGGNGGTGTNEVLDASGKVLTLPKSEWFTLRIEFYKTNDKETTKTRLVILDAEGSLVNYADLSAYTPYGNNSAYTPSKVTVTHYNKGNGYTVYLDDTSMTAVNKHYSSTAPGTPETPDEPENPDNPVNPEEPDDPVNPEPPAENSAVSVLPVYGGATGIVTFMHDDGDYASVIEIDKLLVKYGLVADMALIASRATANYPTIRKWQGVLDTGRWKITSHSATHTWWGIQPEDGDPTKITDNVEKAIAEFIGSQTTLRNAFPGQRVLSFAYPRFSSIYNKYLTSDDPAVNEQILKTYLDSPYIRQLVSENYVAGRVNSGSLSLGSLDEVEWNYMPGTHLVYNASEVISLVEAAATEGRFALVYSHGVVYAEDGEAVSNATPTWVLERVFTVLSSYIEQGLIWNTNYEDAVMYLREAEASTVSLAGDENGYFVTLTDTLDDSMFFHPLTVKLTAPDSWVAARVEQGGRVTYAKVTEKGGERYLLLDIVPDGGEATVIPISLDDIPEEEAPTFVPTPTLNDETDFENGMNTVFVENVFVTKDQETVDPSVTDITSSADYSYMSIATDPKNAANHVLSMVNKRSDAGNGTHTKVYLNTLDKEGSCFVFETRLYLEGLAGGVNGNVLLSINMTLAGTVSNALSIAIKHSSDPTKVYLSWNNGSDYTGNGDIRSPNGELVTLSTDRWYTLRVEFYQTGVAETTRCKIYLTEDGLDETLVADEIAYSYWGLTKAPTFVILKYPRYKAVYSVYLDDVSFRRVERDPGESPKPVELERVAGFDSGNINTPFFESYIYSGTKDAPVLNKVTEIENMDDYADFCTFHLADDPTGAVNKVLKMTTKNQSAVSASYSRVGISNDSAKGPYHTFRARIYLDEMTTSFSGGGFMTVSLSNSKGAPLQITFTKVGDSISANITTGYKETTTVENISNVKEWFAIRVEYYHLGSSATTANTTLKLYVDSLDGSGEKPVFEGVAYSSNSALAAEITHATVSSYRLNSSVVYLDDISLEKQEEQ